MYNYYERFPITRLLDGEFSCGVDGSYPVLVSQQVQDVSVFFEHCQIRIARWYTFYSSRRRLIECIILCVCLLEKG